MCGCQQSPAGGTFSAAPSADVAAISTSDLVPLEYRGIRALLIRGPASGIGYACYPRETIRVRSQDVAHFIASGAFVRTNG